MATLQDKVQTILDHADIQIGGDRPGDIIVHDDRLYGRVLSGGSLALGESYMDGWWDVDQLDEFFYRLLRADLARHIRPTPALIWHYVSARLINLQSIARAFQIGEQHYDTGNDLYGAMLDARMVYTCGYWKDATTLDEAQEAKLDLVCRKLGLQSGQRVLDIGCGWGSWAKFAAEKYGVSVVGVTVSKEQKELADVLCAGLPVDIRLQDYRAVDEQFDHIVSLGMFEHVGSKNYQTYFDVVGRCLKDDGLFLLHTIGGNTSHVTGDPWIMKYIFPNSMLPSGRQIAAASEGRFVMEDWHNFSAYYDRTLMAWWANFDAAWPTLQAQYGDRFYRMWKYYLLSCAGLFRARKAQLWQIVYSKHGVTGGYQSVR